MTISIYADSLTIATRALVQTRHLLETARDQSAAVGKSESEILDLKLAPDMYSFTKQVQIVSDNAKGLASRISDVPAPSMPDTETSFDELIARMDATLEFVASVTVSEDDAIETLEVEFPWLPGKAIAGHDYVVLFAIPNILFHVSMAYANLRTAGVTIGKTVFIGDLPFYDKA